MAAGREESLRADFPATAELFTRMAEEEDGDRHRLIELYRQRFGEHIPLIRRQDVKGFVVRRPSWFTRTLRPENARAEAALMEIESRRIYEAAAQRTNDAGIRQLLDDLAQEEQRHEATAEEITDAQATSGALSHERDAARRLFVLRFTRRVDGWLGIHARALVCRRIRHDEHSSNFQGRACGFSRSRH